MRIAHGFLFCLVMAFATASVCYAQNNPYQIDDECYKYMTEADRLIGKPGSQAGSGRATGSGITGQTQGDSGAV